MRFISFLGISFLLISSLSCSLRNQVIKNRPNIIILLIDALRADSLHDYGNARNTNPFLSELGKKGIRFTNAHTHSSHTKISVASLFTGLIPPAHGVRKAAHLSDDEQNKIVSDVLSYRLTTIAEVLREKKYSTAAFVTNPYIRKYLGFSQGFSDYKYIPWLKTNAALVNKAVINWLQNAPREPFFLYIHYMDVHAPYNPPIKFKYLYSEQKEYPPVRKNGLWDADITKERIDYTRAMYEAQINYWDDCLHSFINRLEKGNWLDNTLFIILGDHGEEFYDHGGFGHGFTLYEEELHVPLYIIYEGHILPTQTRHDHVMLIDIFPTLGHLTGSNLSKLNLHGRNLFSRGKEKEILERINYAETYQGKAPRSIQTDNFKLIYNSRENSFEFYDLLQDPTEKRNVYYRQSQESKTLKEKLNLIFSLYKSGPKKQTKVLDKKTIEQLKSLGYIK